MRFSIITICFNSEKTIERTIKSVMSQTEKDYEYIVVDGASKDSTLDIIRMYEPMFDGRIKWKSEPDEGIYNAMNKGIERASGEIIGIVNSDDWLEPDALSKVANAYEDNNYDTNTLYCGGIVFHYTNGAIKRMDVNLESFRHYSKYYIMSGIRHPATFVPRDIYKRIGVFNDSMRLSADQDFILRCYFSGVQFYEIKAVLSNMSGGGVSTNNTSASLKKASHDRRIMLNSFGISGIKFQCLYYWWLVRMTLATFVKRILNI